MSMVPGSICLLVRSHIQVKLLSLVLLAICVPVSAQDSNALPESEQEVVNPQPLIIEENEPVPGSDQISNIGIGLSAEVDLEASRGLQRKRNQLEHQISQLENEFGPYFQELTEPMLELSEVYRDLGDQESSLVLLDRSLHMVRINSGLDSIEQMPVLRLYADALAFGGEDEKAGAKQFQYFQIAQRTMNPSSDEFIEVMLEMREHHAARFIASKDGVSVRDLVGGYSLSLNLADALEDKYLVEVIVEEDVVVRTMTVNPEYRDNLLWLLSLDYLLFKFGFHERDSMFQTYSPALVSRIGAQRSGAYASETVFFRDPESNYRRGIQRAVALVEMTAQIEGWGSIEHVLAQVILGDWYMLFGRRERAGASYAEALELATTPAVREPLERIFASASELPITKLSAEAFYVKAFEYLNEQTEQTEQIQNSEVQRGFIKFSYNLSVSGRVNGVEIIETNLRYPESVLRQELREMRSTRTRPIFSEAGFVESNGLVKTRYPRGSELQDNSEDLEDPAEMEDSLGIATENSLSTGEAVEEQTQARSAIEASNTEPLNILDDSTREASGGAF